ncbi:hypothetical protein BD770DRAFT_187472 [Pilaira anomala]|nr:hypothetical protein BD770DRAFT_187472 [Pilaira anomala]
MFKELLLISTILGVASLGTELVFRFRPDNNNSKYDVKYNNQVCSNVLLATVAVEVIASIYSTRVLEFMTPKKMKCITVIVVTGLITALAFRSMYGLFHPLNDSQFST